MIDEAVLSGLMDLYRNSVNGDKTAQAIIAKVAAGKNLTYNESYHFAKILGKISANGLADFTALKQMEDCYDTVLQFIRAGAYADVSELAADVQSALNKDYGIGLKGQAAKFDLDKASGIAHMYANLDEYTEVFARNSLETFVNSIVDDTLNANAEFQKSAGLNPRVIRSSNGGCCEWCNKITGVYEYPPPRDVFKRHENCNCTLHYDGQKLKFYKSKAGKSNTFRAG